MSASLVLIPPMASTCRRPSAATAARYRAGVTDCVFCDIIAGTVPAQIVLDDEVAVAFLDARPVFKGHVLVAPRQHYETLPDLPAGLVGPLFTRVQRLSAAVLAAFAPQPRRRPARLLLAAGQVRRRRRGGRVRPAAPRCPGLRLTAAKD
jgi:hypothetical protein